MFSEYASRFLAQSQTRMSAIRDGRYNNPPNQAPLFHSTAEYLPDDPEHEQEVQDFYALKSSRRHFGAYTDSHATLDEEEEEDDQDGDYSEESTQELRKSRGKFKGRLLGSGNIRSSWRMSKPGASLNQSTSKTGSVFSDGTERASGSGKGKERMVEIRLDDSVRLGMVPDDIDQDDMVDYPSQGPSRNYIRRYSTDEEAERPPDDIAIEMPEEDSPPTFQQFRKASPEGEVPAHFVDRKTSFMPRLSDPSEQRLQRTLTPQQVSHPLLEPPVHDGIWSTLYLVLMACMFSTSFVIWLHTEEPKIPLGDTMYRALHSGVHLLAVDMLLAIGVSLMWMYLLRSFVKPLVYLLLISVPFVLITLSMYPLVMSYRGKWGGTATQDKAMRWGSIVPAAMAGFWSWFAWRGRNALGRAVGIIQLACRVLGDNPALVLLSFGTLVGICVFTWMWVGMFTRVFLAGNNGLSMWMLDSKTMALGAWYILMYLWTLGISSGLQRATSAATVSQWYFHRHAIPTTSSKAVMSAALHHSTTTLFGTVCFSSLVALLVRVPIMVVPARIAGVIHLLCFNFIASPIAALTDPLTLTYAAIHSQPLIPSSRTMANMRFSPSAAHGVPRHPRTAYKLSKMILSATRCVTALSLGIGAWIATARDANSPSMYGYIVGMIAGAIGWGILGATEGCLSNIVDACLVCVGSEGVGGAHCREAQIAFGM
ncbi:hypothetical protein RUND412_002764 [Rhizina undulata]